MKTADGKVLDGVRVVDLSRVLAGPYCAQLLADFGADVIKVEGPGGDENRAWPPLGPGGDSANFASVNRGKRSLVLDLKTPAARDILLRLAGEADVLLHSFLPDTAARLGISQERLRADNPRLVVATISGYGAKGPLAEKRGYDLMVQAFAGVMSTTGLPGGPPLRCGLSFIDMSTGLSLYGGIVTALLARTATGQGTWVHGSLLETAVALLGHTAVAWMQAGVLPEPQGSGSSLLVPYQAFRCQDGIVLAGAPNDGAWFRFCDALGCAELAADPRFHGNLARVASREILIPLLERRFALGTVAHWLERFEARSVACAPVQMVDQVMRHPQVVANAMRVRAHDVDGLETDLVGTPFKLAWGGGVAASAAPRLGADTAAVMGDWLGLSERELGTWRQAGAFGG
ncbi:CaiB/BaiF CoA transferase family protein [Rhodopila sp.]|uniref:CaiB/BaiF CoA transferase family protein n=1 Tax=Rhodopila sp. TaxID=2480087 RepID=UPI003D0ED215